MLSLLFQLPVSTKSPIDQWVFLLKFSSPLYTGGELSKDSDSMCVDESLDTNQYESNLCHVTCTKRGRGTESKV